LEGKALASRFHFAAKIAPCAAVPNIDPKGLTVIILSGEFAGQEGVCLGRAGDGDELWAVSPHGSDRIVNLRLEEEFGVLVNPSQEAGRN
jgi:hypothetical protein